MANGILGQGDLAALTYTNVYDVPVDTFSVVTVSICNKQNTSITVRLAIRKAGQPLPQADDYLEYETEILPYGVLERSGIVIDAERSVFVHSARSGVAQGNSADTSVVVYGIETATA